MAGAFVIRENMTLKWVFIAVMVRSDGFQGRSISLFGNDAALRALQEPGHSQEAGARYLFLQASHVGV